MKYFRISGLTIAAVGITMTLASCVSEEPTQNGYNGVTAPLTANMGLPGSSPSRAGAQIGAEADEWSYYTFRKGDVLGLYSQYGNIDGGDPAFNNEALEYLQDASQMFQFRSSKLFAPEEIVKGGIFLYFPWSEDISSSPGLDLRKLGEDAMHRPTLRCEDFLMCNTMDKESMTDYKLYGNFDHTFGEIIITRGEGFDNPKNEFNQPDSTIHVVMKNPYTHVYLSKTSNPWAVAPKLYNEVGYDADNSPYFIDARTWEAWRGKDYAVTISDGSNEEEITKPAWYVILPTIPNNPTEIDYIELYDNEGVLQRVTSIPLMNGSRKIETGWRYPIMIEMKELVPTVFPFRVIPWNANKDLTQKRTRGISSADDFQKWINAYNQFLSSGRSFEEELFNYGDKYTDLNTNTDYWHFHLLNNIDISSLMVNGAYIATLEDVLDGEAPTLSDGFRHDNLTITGMKAPLVGSLRGQNAGVENITIGKNTLINSTTITPIGVIANGMSGGAKVDNCIINDIFLVSRGPVGAIAGQLNNGSITNCTVSGTLIGTESTAPEYLIGTAPTGSYIYENNVSSVIFDNN